MTTLYLLRHGETEENARHILQGNMPGHLSAEGRRQVQEAAERLRLVSFDALLSSDLQRCVDTAHLVLQAWTSGDEPAATQTEKIQLRQTPLLRERDWGSATGMVVDGVHKITIPADAESMKAIKVRAQTLLDFVRDDYPSQTVLAISHGLFCRVLQAVHYGKDMADIERMGNAEHRILHL